MSLLGTPGSPQPFLGRYPGCGLIVLGVQGVQSELQKALDELQLFPIMWPSVTTPAQVSAAQGSRPSTMLRFYFLSI